MRIDSSSTPISAIPSDKPAEPQVQRAHHSHHAGEVVQLSAAGAAASASSTTAASAVDPKRLASIKAAIQNGTYPVDLDKLAGKIVDEDA